MEATVTIVSTSCYHCGQAIYLPEGFDKRRRNDHQTFYCPYCSGGQCYTGESKAEKLARELKAAKAREKFAQQRADDWRERADHQEARARGYKGAMVKTKKKLDRVEKGVCPECNRTFQNLARHMETKHSHAAK